MRIDWRPLALDDLLAIVEYIAVESLPAAYDVQDNIERQVSALRDHPELGRRGRVGGTRELIISGFEYVVAYRLTGDCIEVLRVLHTSRQWPCSILQLES